MNYVSPLHSTEEQIDFAYANLHPNYRSKIERDQVKTLEELVFPMVPLFLLRNAFFRTKTRVEY